MSERVDVLAVIRHHGAGMRVSAAVANGLKLTANACKNFADEMDRVEAAVAELLAFQAKAAPLARAIVSARTEVEEAAACKALAKLYKDDLNAALAADEGTPR